MSWQKNLLPSQGDWINLDNAASTPLFPELIEIYPKLQQLAFANPSSPHKLGTALKRHLANMERELLSALYIPPAEATVIWTSGGTEANNLALTGCMRGYPCALILTSSAEHASVANTLRTVGNAQTLTIDSKGQLIWDALEQRLQAVKPRLISVTSVQNETGVIHDLIRLRQMMQQAAPEGLLHTDAVQAAGKLPIPWQEASLDILSISGHKFHGPGGVGALIIRKGLELYPLIHGGGQQNGLRSGSIDVVGITAMTIAASHSSMAGN